jgi:hypothetical protein
MLYVIKTEVGGCYRGEYPKDPIADFMRWLKRSMMYQIKPHREASKIPLSSPLKKGRPEASIFQGKIPLPSPLKKGRPEASIFQIY